MNVGSPVRVNISNAIDGDEELQGKTGTVVRFGSEPNSVFVQVEGQKEPLWFAPSELVEMQSSDPLVDAVNRLTATLEKVLDKLTELGVK